MKIKVKEFVIDIDESIFIVFLLCVAFKEVRSYFENYFVCFLFIAFHELSHMFIASILGIKTKRLRIHVSGLNINLKKTKTHEPRWLFVFVAGPLSNIILAICFKNVPMVYTINLALALINLIPVYPFDGYHIFELILVLTNISDKSIKKIQKYTEIMVIIMLVIIGILMFVFYANLSVILMVFYIFIQASNLRKNCNSGMYQKCYKNITNF